MFAAVGVSAISAAMNGLLWKWYMGSAIDQNTKPIPMPALNSIANQEKYPNSGRSSSFPRRMLP